MGFFQLVLGRLRGRATRRTAAGLLILVLAGGGLWLARAPIAGWLILSTLSSRGVDIARLTVERIGLHRIEITGIRIGRAPDLTAKRIVAEYDPLQMIEGRLSGIELDGATLRAGIDESGLTLGAVAPLLRGSGTAMALPPVTLTNARILLATPAGSGEITGAGHLSPTSAGGVAAEGEVSLITAWGTAPITVSAQVAPDGATEATLDLSPTDLAGTLGSGAQTPFHVIGLAGKMTIRRPAGTRQPRFTAHLDTDAATVRDVALGPATTRVDFDGALLQVRTRLEPGGDTTAAIEADYQPFADPPLLTVEANLSATHGNDVLRLFDADRTADLAGPVTADGVLALTGAPTSLSGNLVFNASARNLRRDATSIAAAHLVLRAGVTLFGRRLTITPQDGTQLRLDDFRDGSLVSVSAPVTLAPDVTRSPRMTIDAPAASGPAWTADVTVLPSPFVAHMRRGNTPPVEIRGQTPRIAISASGAVAGSATWSATLSDGKLSTSPYHLVLDGIGGTLRSGAPYDKGAPLAELQIATIRQDQETPLVVPLSATASVRDSEDGLDFRARIADSSDRLSISMSGTVDPGANDGSARIGLHRIELGPGVPLERLFPVLRGRVEDVTGTLGLWGRVTWHGNRMNGRAKLLIKDLSAKFGDIGLTRVNTVLTFDSQQRKSQPKRQEIAIAGLDLGVPLRDGLVTLGIDRTGRLIVEDMGWKLAGGEVHARNFTIDPDATRQHVLLSVENVDLGQLVHGFDVEGLSATGRLDGGIPVTIVGGDVAIRGGELHTRKSGTLIYHPVAYPGGLDSGSEAVQLTLQALRNFHYDSLYLTLNREITGDAVLAIHLKGKNPDLYDGYPISLNLNISGKLDRIVSQSLEGYRVPERIRQQMKDFGD